MCAVQIGGLLACRPSRQSLHVKIVSREVRTSPLGLCTPAGAFSVKIYRDHECIICILKG